jgi:F-type H+-transporting ATPase subunit delta
MSDKQARAQRYAQAVMQAILEQWQGALQQVETALSQDRQLSTLVRDSSKPFDERAQALTSVLPAGAPVELQNLLKLLVQEEEIDLVGEIGLAMSEVASGQQQPTKAEVVSAVELSDAEKDSLRQVLSKQFGENLVFTFQVDPALMGGLRVRVGDRLIDTSVASRLAALRESLTSVVR